jgi:hypothetical protein
MTPSTAFAAQWMTRTRMRACALDTFELPYGVRSAMKATE